jgi:hypothetical protein
LGSKARRVGAGLMAAALLPGVTEATPAATTEGRSRRPIRDSIERHVERVLKSHERPCPPNAEGGEPVPCFPVSLEVEGPRFSVIDALRRFRIDGRDQRPTPGVPTNAELRGQMGVPDVKGFSFDPVCAAKSVARAFKGAPSTFYLYRFTDKDGERPLLRESKLDPAAYAARPDIHYEFLGQFDGECEAIAAWRKALRETRAAAGARRSLLSDEPPRQQASPGGSGP